MESKNDRFRRLAQSRGERLLREMRLIGNLANKKNYEYDKSDVDALFAPLERELRETRALFDPDKTSERRIEF